MELNQFNTLDEQDARSVVTPCLDIERWVTAVVAGRPYDSVEAAIELAEQAAEPFTTDEVDSALAHHPRIGERAAGDSAEADLSRGEQAALSTDEQIQADLLAGNKAYEDKFGQVFLIRAAGRSAEEILDQLNTRLGNDAETEAGIIADQLRQIAVLRLSGALQ